MSKLFSIGLIIIFIVHFLVALKIFMKRKRAHSFFLMVTFLLLIIYLVTRWVWFDLSLLGYHVYAYFRIAAWITTGLGVLLYLRFKLTSWVK